jgi:hypothetical protein
MCNFFLLEGNAPIWFAPHRGGLKPFFFAAKPIAPFN